MTTTPLKFERIKIKMKLKEAEFEAEGPHDLLKDYYERFVNAVLFASEEKTVSPQAQSFLQKGFDQLLSREDIDLFMATERYIRKVRGYSRREWPHALLDWEVMHPEEKKEEHGN